MKISESKITWILATMIMIGVCGVTFGIAYTQSYFEANAYNKVTGKNITAWDAMFISLRVEACVK